MYILHIRHSLAMFVCFMFAHVHKSLHVIVHLYTALGIIGEIEENPLEESKKDFYLLTHKKFDIGFNGNQVCVVIKSLTRLNGSTIIDSIFNHYLHYMQTICQSSSLDA